MKVWIQVRPDILSGLVWVQTVCKLSADDLAGRVKHLIKVCIKKNGARVFSSLHAESFCTLGNFAAS